MFLQESFYFEETFAIKYENEEVPDIVFRSVMNIVQPLESKRFFQPGSCCSMGMRVRWGSHYYCKHNQHHLYHISISSIPPTNSQNHQHHHQRLQGAQFGPKPCFLKPPPRQVKKLTEGAATFSRHTWVGSRQHSQSSKSPLFNIKAKLVIIIFLIIWHQGKSHIWLKYICPQCYQCLSAAASLQIPKLTLGMDKTQTITIYVYHHQIS